MVTGKPPIALRAGLRAPRSGPRQYVPSHDRTNASVASAARTGAQRLHRASTQGLQSRRRWCACRVIWLSALASRPTPTTDPQGDAAGRVQPPDRAVARRRELLAERGWPCKGPGHDPADRSGCSNRSRLATGPGRFPEGSPKRYANGVAGRPTASAPALPTAAPPLRLRSLAARRQEQTNVPAHCPEHHERPKIWSRRR